MRLHSSIHSFIHSFVHSFLPSFIHSGHFYSASSSSLTTQKRSRHNTDTVRSFTSKRHRQLRVKDLPKVQVPTWWLERDSNPRPSGRKASTLPMRQHVPPRPINNSFIHSLQA